jgi:phosphotriesterase-related protein
MGPLLEEDLGLILPHEHIFVDFRTPDHPAHARADVAAVVALMAPQVDAARAQGVTALVDCTPVGVGRRADAVKAVSDAVGFPIVIPTGIYREPWVPRWAHDWTESRLTDWMIEEMTDGIEATGVQAGWIKLSAGDDGLTECETKVLRAAARAAAATGAVIGSHTVRGSVLLEQAAVIEGAGYTADRFIWIHAQFELDRGLHLEAARRGVWVEYDGIGAMDDASLVTCIRQLLDAGFQDRILLSQDRGWFDPALPGGGTPQPFTYLVERFIPTLLDAGVDVATIRRLTHKNPFAAYAR